MTVNASESCYSRLGTLRLALIFLIPVTAAVGSYLLPLQLGGIKIYGFRLLILLVMFLTPLLTYRFHWWGNWIARSYFILGVIWTSWGALSILWAPDVRSAARDVLAIIFGFLVAFALLSLGAYTKHGVRALSLGWVGAYIATMVVAVWEIVTGNHLPSAFTEQAAGYAQAGLVVSTLGNPNNYGAFLVLAFPFLWLSYSWATRLYSRVFYLTLLITTPLLIILSASRLALLAFGLEILAYVFINIMYPRRLLNFLPFLIAVGLVSGVYISNPESRIHHKVVNAPAEIGNNGSISVRINLALNALWMIYETDGRGVGAGGFEAVHVKGSVPYWTKGIINPHNFWLEVLSEYGILVFALFAGWYLMLFTLVLTKRIRLRRNGDVKDREDREIIRKMLVVALAGYVFASVANSSYVTQPTNWTFLASVVIMSVRLMRPEGDGKHRSSVF